MLDPKPSRGVWQVWNLVRPRRKNLQLPRSLDKNFYIQKAQVFNDYTYIYIYIYLFIYLNLCII